MTMPSDATMRTAIRERDARYDGRFVYAVITTGVFCRPSCKARPARPENVRFFQDAGAALAAGYRPCLRCRPLGTAPELEPLIEVARHIENHAAERLTLAALAARAGQSPSRFQRAFKAAFGVSPKVFQDAVRLRTLRDSLRSGDDVSGAIAGAGFGSTSRVYGEAARNIGMTPSAYRAGGAGETLAWACRETAYGCLLMAATERGVCFAQFGADRESLLERLTAEFPKARLAASPAQNAPDLDHWIDALEAHLDRAAPRPEVPLDLRGTAFQISVWRFLLGLAEGDVISYRELATGIGRPGAVRAAASACAANRVAVLVPCHRVLRGDGSLGGYRWGIERKRALLDRERAAKMRGQRTPS